MALLTPDEAAVFLKVSKSMIYQRRDISHYRSDWSTNGHQGE